MTRNLESETEGVEVVAAQPTMRAIVQDEYGTSPEDVLRVEEISRPAPADDEVLVRLRAAGVDRGTWHLMAGLPYMVRLAGYGVRSPKNRVPGLDGAGVVEAVGKGVASVAAGDEVYGTFDGSFAEYATAPAKRLAHKPAKLTFEQAAAVPVSGLTALQGVRDKARIQPGQTVLVLGASGGVGSFAVQIAKAFGGEVTGVCSTGKVDFVQQLGADHVVDYTKDDPTDGTQRYDAILDMGGTRHLSHLRRALTPKGCLVIVGGETDGRWLGGTDRQLRAMLLSPFVGQRLVAFVSSENTEDLQVLAGLADEGKLTPQVDRAFALSEAAAAVRYLSEGRVRGKVVITI